MGKRWLLIGLSVAAVAIAAVVVVVLLAIRPDARVIEAAPTADAAGDTPAPTTTPAPAAEPSPSSPALASPTCENIMAPHFATDWVPVVHNEPEPVFAAGISCLWAADPDVGTDNVLQYAWAPHTPAEWDAFTTDFLSGDSGEGWFLEEGERGVYLTHKTDYWVRDEAGYGHTYLFTGDAIVSAATKAETDDVIGPPPA